MCTTKVWDLKLRLYEPLCMCASSSFQMQYGCFLYHCVFVSDLVLEVTLMRKY